MPKILKENDMTATVQRDDGEVVTVAKTKSGADYLNKFRTEAPPPANPVFMGGRTPDVVAAPEGAEIVAPAAAVAPTINPQPSKGVGEFVDGSGSEAVDTKDLGANGGKGSAPATVDKTTTQSSSYGSTARSALDDSYEAAHKAAASSLELQASQDLLNKASLDEQTALMAENMSRRAAEAERRDRDLSDMFAQSKKLQNEFANAKVQDGHLWGDEGTGNKLLAGIGLALGAFGAGATGSENPAVGIIERAISRDIDVQKANIATLGTRAEAARGMLKDYMDVYKDKDAAAAAAEAAQLNWVKTKLAAQTAGLTEPTAKARADGLYSAIAEKQANKEAEVNKIVSTKETVPLSSVAAKVERPGDVSAKDTRDQALQIRNYSQLLNMLDDVKENLGPAKGRWKEVAASLGWGDVKYAQFQQKYGDLFNRYKNEITGSASAPAEVKQLLKGFGSPFDNPANLRAKLESSRDSLAAAYQMAIDQYTAQDLKHGLPPLESLMNTGRGYGLKENAKP